MREARDHLEVNYTRWVNHIGVQLRTVESIFEGLIVGATSDRGRHDRRPIKS